MATAVSAIAPGKYTPEATHQLIIGGIRAFNEDSNALGGVYYRPRDKKDKGKAITERALKRAQDLTTAAGEMKAATRSAKHLSRTEKANLGYKAAILTSLAKANANLARGTYSVDEALKPVAPDIVKQSISIASSKNIGDLRVGKENIEALETTNAGSVGQVIARNSSKIQKIDEALTDDTSAPFTGRAARKEAPGGERGHEGGPPAGIPPELLAAAQQRAAA